MLHRIAILSLFWHKARKDHLTNQLSHWLLDDVCFALLTWSLVLIQVKCLPPQAEGRGMGRKVKFLPITKISDGTISIPQTQVETVKDWSEITTIIYRTSIFCSTNTSRILWFTSKLHSFLLHFPRETISLFGIKWDKIIAPLTYNALSLCCYFVT